MRGLRVEVVRKDIKNLHLGVYPPNGRIRVAAPTATPTDSIRLAVIKRLPWIQRQRERFVSQPRETEREQVTGESHYFFGRRYRLNVIETDGRARVQLVSKTRIELHVPPHASQESKAAVLDRWYRSQLRDAALPIIAKWETELDAHATFWGFKRMKTKWGSCNPTSKRVWLNTELAKKPSECLEYIIVHELVHLIEPRHGQEFVALMDHNLPDWRRRRSLLNSSPLAHESWSY